MSLYIGKDNDNINTLIISKSNVTKESLKASTSFSTDIIFNSKFPYAIVSYQEFVNPIVTTIDSRAPWGFNQTILTCDSELTAAYLNNQRIYLFIDDVLVDVILYNYPTYLQRYWYTPSIVNSYLSLKIHIPLAITSINKVKVLFLPFKNDFTNISTGLYGGSILIQSGEFLINNHNFFNKKFLVAGAINNIDPSITILGTSYQVVNGYTSNGSIKLTADSGIKLYANSKLVLDSLSSAYIPLYEDTASTIYSNSITNFYTNGYPNGVDQIRAVPSTSDGAIYIIQYKVWSNPHSEPSAYSWPIILKVGIEGMTTVYYNKIPSAAYPEPFWFFAVDVYLTSEGYLKFRYPLVQAGDYYPIENVYYGPYNCKVRSRRIG